MQKVDRIRRHTSSITVSSSTITLGQSSTVTLTGFVEPGIVFVVPSTHVSIITNSVIVITPTKSGEYTVYFIDQSGCKHILKIIEVEVITNACNDGVVYLPTGFTPNNDGANDKYN